MRIDILTVLPEMVGQALGHSIIKRAIEAGRIEINVVNIRDFATGRHHMTDDTPCGGGGGMIMMIDPIAAALVSLPRLAAAPRVLLTDPQGELFTQAKARKWAQEEHIVLLCGHYEGVDERVREHLVTESVSIGDYVLTGGELPALVIADALTRLQPGALGDEYAPENDSFAGELLEFPHYTRPRIFRGWEAPQILFSGHHALITRWRRWHQLQRTRAWRPDIWARFSPSVEDLKLLDETEPAITDPNR